MALAGAVRGVTSPSGASPHDLRAASDDGPGERREPGTSAMPTASQAARQPHAWTIAPTAGNAIMNPTLIATL